MFIEGNIHRSHNERLTTFEVIAEPRSEMNMKSNEVVEITVIEKITSFYHLITNNNWFLIFILHGITANERLCRSKESIVYNENRHKTSHLEPPNGISNHVTMLLMTPEWPVESLEAEGFVQSRRQWNIKSPEPQLVMDLCFHQLLTLSPIVITTWNWIFHQERPLHHWNGDPDDKPATVINITTGCDATMIQLRFHNING